VSASDIIECALALAVALLGAFAFVTTFYFGAIALADTVRDIWRWSKVCLETRRREREEMLQESMREMTR
jgi:hypothetical protein